MILVIEPDRARRNALMATLHAAGFGVVAVATGAQALATVESRVVSLVLAGPHLPGLSGAAVLQKLREGEAKHHLAPVPFMQLAGEQSPAGLAVAARQMLAVAPLPPGPGQ